MGDEQVCAELVEAFSEGDAEDARALLKKHPHLSDYVDPETQGTLLQIAALRGHSDCVEAALEAGADHEITHPVYGMTPFLWACSEAHLMCVQQLVRAGCNTEARDSSGLTGQELAKDHLEPGWQSVVTFLAEHTGTTIDVSKEHAHTTEQQRRMRKVLGDAGDEEDALSLLFTTEQLQPGSEQTMRKKLRELFQEIDLDNSGDLCAEEVARLSTNMGADLNAAELDEAMREMDADGDGRVDFEEFQTWWMTVGEEKSTWTFRVHLDTRKSAKALMEEELTAEKEAQLRSAFTSEQIEQLFVIVDARLEEAETHGAAVTAMLTAACKKCKGKMFGLEFKVKERESTFSKVIRKMPPAHGMSPEEQTAQFTKAICSLRDLLRYTMVVKTKNYVKGVTDTIALLESKSVRPIPHTVKNFWRRKGQDTDYLGINASFRTASAFSKSGEVIDGFPFELQFHTEESIETKMDKAHYSFEQFRLTTGLEKLQYWEDMVRMWGMVPIPPGPLFEIGTKAYHGVDRKSLEETLSEEELARHKFKRSLEARVRPACDGVYAENRKLAEELTPNIIARAQKDNGSLRGEEHICKSAMSMTRQVVGTLAKDLDVEARTASDKLDASSIDRPLRAAVDTEKRNALRYTVVFPEKSYTRGVQRVLEFLKKQGFDEELLNNYWKTDEPYNAVRGRLHMSEKDGVTVSNDLAVVFHTEASLELSEERMVRYQEAMGIVFHTATFTGNDEAREQADALMLEDAAWQTRVKQLGGKLPKGAESLGKIIEKTAPVKKPAKSVALTRQTSSFDAVSFSSGDSFTSQLSTGSDGAVRFDNPIKRTSGRASSKRRGKSNTRIGEMSVALSQDFDSAMDPTFEADTAQQRKSKQSDGGLFGCCGRKG